MKTADLKGPLLAYWYARALGAKKLVRLQGNPGAYTECEMSSVMSDFDGFHEIWMSYRPYEDGHEMYAVMSKYDIYAIPLLKSAGKGFEIGPRAYEASCGNTDRYVGPTLGEAICKAIIAKNIGAEVSDEL